MGRENLDLVTLHPEPRPAFCRAAPETAGHWAGTWTAAPQLTEPGNMPPPPFTQDNLAFANSTLRQTIHVTIGGEEMRLRFSNAYGGAVLPITAGSCPRSTPATACT